MNSSREHTRQELDNIAGELNLLCVVAQQCELLLDFDTPDLPAQYFTLHSLMRRHGINVVGELKTVSKSGNCHLYLKLDVSITPLQRIALQACMGSDPVREFFSVLRIHNSSEVITALFETTKEYIRVTKWRAQHATSPYHLWTAPEGFETKNYDQEK